MKILISVSLLLGLAACASIPQLGIVPSPYPTYTYYPTYTPIPTYTAAAHASENPSATPGSTTKSLTLYGLEIVLPAGWSIAETNRRPEPTGLEGTNMGHDCADYEIRNVDGRQLIQIKMPCGSGEGSPVNCAPGTQIIGYVDDKNFFAREPIPSKNLFAYTDAFLMTFSDLSGEHETLACWSPPAYSSKAGMLTIEYTYAGKQLEEVRDFDAVDSIVRSLR